MKVYISNYRDHWISPYTILKSAFFWRKDYDAYDEEPPVWLTKVCEGLKAFLDKIHPQINYVKIDSYDTYSMDETLGKIILPMLKQLKTQKQGAPLTDDEDVPDAIKSMNAPRVESPYDIDEFHFLRWDYVLDQMIWSFEQVQPDCAWEDEYHTESGDDWDGYAAHQKRIQNGFRLFGKYFQNLWS
jgi:hypothetical protein